MWSRSVGCDTPHFFPAAVPRTRSKERGPPPRHEWSAVTGWSAVTPPICGGPPSSSRPISYNFRRVSMRAHRCTCVHVYVRHPCTCVTLHALHKVRDSVRVTRACSRACESGTLVGERARVRHGEGSRNGHERKVHAKTTRHVRRIRRSACTQHHVHVYVSRSTIYRVTCRVRAARCTR